MNIRYELTQATGRRKKERRYNNRFRALLGGAKKENPEKNPKTSPSLMGKHPTIQKRGKRGGMAKSDGYKNPLEKISLKKTLKKDDKKENLGGKHPHALRV